MGPWVVFKFKTGISRWSRASIEEYSTRRYKECPIVLFGFFQVEEVFKPAVVEDAAKLFLIADPDSRMVGATQAISGDISFLLERLWDMSSKSYNDAPTPPL